MERSPHPTPINPNAKYLSNSISNVLYSIQKFDQGTLAWPTGPRKRNVWTKPKSRSPPGVPLAGTGSSVIPKSKRSRSKYDEGVDKKNTFYQILQASQDQPRCQRLEKSGRPRRTGSKYEFSRDDDRIYSDIYDILKMHLQGKRHSKPEENQRRRFVPPIALPPVRKIYKVRPRDTQTTTQQKQREVSKSEKTKPKSSKAKYPIVETYKPRKKTNEQNAHKGEPSKAKSKHSKKKIFPIWTVVHKRRKRPIKYIDKSQTRIPEIKMNQDNSQDSPAARIPIKHKHYYLPQKEYSKNGFRPQHESPKPVYPKKDIQTDLERPKEHPKTSSTFQNKYYKVQNHRDNIEKSTQRQQTIPLIKDELIFGLKKFLDNVPKLPHQKDNTKGSTQRQQKPTVEQQDQRYSNSKNLFYKAPAVKRIAKEFINKTIKSNETRRIPLNSEEKRQKVNSAAYVSRPNDSSKEPGTSKGATYSTDPKVKSNFPIGKSPMKEINRILEKSRKPSEEKPIEVLTKLKPPTHVPELPPEENYMRSPRNTGESQLQGSVMEGTLDKQTGLKPETPKVETVNTLERPKEHIKEQGTSKGEPVNTNTKETTVSNSPIGKSPMKGQNRILEKSIKSSEEMPIESPGKGMDRISEKSRKSSEEMPIESPGQGMDRISEKSRKSSEEKPIEVLTKLKPPTYIPPFPPEENYMGSTRNTGESQIQGSVLEGTLIKQTELKPETPKVETVNTLDRPKEDIKEQGTSKGEQVNTNTKTSTNSPPEEKARKSSVERPSKYLPTYIPKFHLERKSAKKTGEKELQDNVIEETPKKAIGFERKIKTRKASHTKFWRLRISKIENSDKYSKVRPNKVQQQQQSQAFMTGCTPQVEIASIASELLRDGVESPLELAPPRRLSLDRRRFLGSLASRKTSDDYQEKLRKLKLYLNKYPSAEDGLADTSSLDLEGIHDRDLLLYPYNDIFEEKQVTEVNDNGGGNKKNKSKRKHRLKPPKKGERPPEVEEESKEPLKKKSACCVCRTIRCPGKEAPFLEEMRKEQRRQELMAYRATMALGKGSNRARQPHINGLDKKLYTLEDSYIVFTTDRDLKTRPKKSNSTIFPTPSKCNNTFLKRCSSFIYPKESSSITCP